MVHHSPGLPSRNPGRRPMEYSKLRSGSSVSKGTRLRRMPYVSRSSSAVGCWAGSPRPASSGPMTYAVAAPDCTRTVPDGGTVTSRSARPPAGTVTRRSSTGVGLFRSPPSTASRRNGSDAQTGIAPLSVLMMRTRTCSPGSAGDAGHVLLAVEGSGAAVGVGDADEVLVLLDAVAGKDDERAEQAADHLLVGDLVGVVPERPDLVGDEPVGVLAALGHRVLGHPGDAVLGIRHVDAVPVQGDAVLDRGVAQVHLDELALGRGDGRARGLAVERVPVDLTVGGEPHLSLTGDEVDRDVRLALGVGHEVLDAGAALMVGAVRVAGLFGPPP